VLSTLRDLLATGDGIRKVEGVFSGSLSFVFNTLSPSSASSSGSKGQSSSSPSTLASVVRRARDLGYTEPDPRDDLSGTDVARKAVILARAISLSLSPSPSLCGRGDEGPPGRKLLELSDVPVRSLIPPHLSDRSSVDVEAFLVGLAADDGGVGAEVEKARLEGKVLRYVGVVTVGEEGNVAACLTLLLGAGSGRTTSANIPLLLSLASLLAAESNLESATPVPPAAAAAAMGVARGDSPKLPLPLSLVQLPLPKLP